MDIKTAMLQAGADYTAVLSRFGGAESLLKKYVKKFSQDPTYGQLCDSVARKDAEKIYFYGHTLKGVSSNLGFDRLSALCANTIVTARDKEMSEVLPLFEKVKEEYETLLVLIQSIE